MPKTVSAGGIIVNQKGEVALVKNGPDFWGFPKGHIDPGEDALVAAKREIEEETGLTRLSIVREYPAYERLGGRDMSELKSISMFLFTTEESDLSPKDPANPEARWVKASEVAGILTHPKDREFFESADITIPQQ